MSSTISRLAELTPENIRQYLTLYLDGYKFEDLDSILECVSDFTRQVLTEVCKVEWGTIVTYKELAKRIGRPDAIRAVAGALGRNPYPFLIPCHRVVATDGSLGGYAWGSELKRALLAYEGVILNFQ